MNISEAKELISEFVRLPKTVKQVTYLELCRHPRQRFEEITSRLLCFYLNPKGEHLMGDLLLRSLLYFLTPQHGSAFSFRNVEIINEENADGKRIDILIRGDNFVVGIENKITASLYNDLGTYKRRIDVHSTKNKFGVVLSLKALSHEIDRAFMKEHSFMNITYQEYFSVVKQHLGDYIDKANTKHLMFLSDFMQTLQNMDNTHVTNPEADAYFFENSAEIEKLISLFNNYKNRVSQMQTTRIDELKEKISERTGTDKWWVWKGYDLGCNQFESSGHKVGIESFFKAESGNPFGKFYIYISTWRLAAWQHYRDMVLAAFPEREKNLKINRDKVELHIETLDGWDEETILNTLHKHYDFLKNLINFNASAS